MFPKSTSSYYSEEELKAREKKKPGQWWSSVQTSWWREDAIQRAQKSMESILLGNAQSPERLVVVKDFQRKWEVKFDSRFRFDRVEAVDVSSDTLMSEFAKCIWLHVNDSEDADLRWTYRHYGNWSDNSYNLIVAIKIRSLDLVRKILGTKACSPRQWADAGVYNPNPTVGPVRGGRIHLQVSEKTPMTITYNFRTQSLRMVCSYRKTRWIDYDYDKSYEADNGTAIANFSLVSDTADEPDMNNVLSQLQDILASCQ